VHSGSRVHAGTDVMTDANGKHPRQKRIYAVRPPDAAVQ